MADEKVSALSSATPVATDLLYVVTDALGTPVSSKTDISTLAGVMAPLIGAVTGSGQANQVAYWTDTDEIGGNAGFTFEDSSGSVPFAKWLTVGSGGSGVHGVSNIFSTETLADGNFFFGLNSQLSATVPMAMASGGVVVPVNASAYVPGTGAIGTVLGVSSYVEIDGPTTGLAVAIYADVDIDSGTTAEAIGVQVADISGATTNRAIQTGSGDVRLGTLAGTGTRYVYCDDDGNLVAGAAV